MRGGGVHVKSCTIITVHQQGTIQVVVECTKVNPKLYLLKTMAIFDSISNWYRPETRDMMIFSGNQASYGGTVYVADDTNFGACSPNIEFFIQSLTLHQEAKH